MARKYEEGPKFPNRNPITTGATTEPALLASTSVDEAETRLSGGTQSFARAAKSPYRGNTNAPNRRFKTI